MRLYICDMGGVMVDGFDVTSAMAPALGMDLGELRTMMEAAGADELHEGTLTATDYWARFEALTGLTLPGEPWRDYFAPERRPAMYALVERLKAAGARVVVGTNTIDAHYEVHVARGDYAVFDHVYASNLMGVSKPKPDFWLRILAAEAARPADAVFIDDMPVNVAAAASLGIRSVQFVSQEQAIKELEAALAGTGESAAK
ncbi:MAG TPA: HAD-IA family hydrolase [Trueperaceae bacterium]|nr:HAD-IA family hydrolase [Trueperaceae bacterium]